MKKFIALEEALEDVYKRQDHNGRNIIIVVLNCPTRWEATERVYEYVKANYS